LTDKSIAPAEIQEGLHQPRMLKKEEYRLTQWDDLEAMRLFSWQLFSNVLLEERVESARSCEGDDDSLWR